VISANSKDQKRKRVFYTGLADNSPFKDLTACSEHEPTSGTKGKLTTSSRPILECMPKIGGAEIATRMYAMRSRSTGSAYTTPRGSSDRPISRCAEWFFPLTRARLRRGCHHVRGTYYLLFRTKILHFIRGPRTGQWGWQHLHLQMIGVAAGSLSALSSETKEYRDFPYLTGISVFVRSACARVG
jgi:hypothetical protein